MTRRALTLAALLAAAPAAAAPQRGVTDTEVVFGMVGPFSGSAKELGRAMKVGIDVAFAVTNEAGGVEGRKLRLLAIDDGYEPARTKTAVADLLGKGQIFGFIGNVGTANAAVALPLASEKSALFFGALSGAPLLRNDPPDKLVFNYRPSYAEETAAAVKHLVEIRRVKPSQIAVLAQEDGFGEAGFSGVAHMLRKYRRDPAQVVRAGYRRNTADVDEAVRTILKNASHLRAVVMVATYRAAAKFIEKLRSERTDLLFTNVSAVDSNELAEELMQLGPRYAEGVMVTQVVPLPNAKASAILRYQDALARHAPGERPGFLSLEGYIAGRILVEGLRRAGKDLTSDSLVEALEGIRGLDLGFGVPITFGPSEHQASHKIWGTALDASGAYRTFELE